MSTRAERKKSKSIEQSTDTDQPCTSSMHIEEEDAICCECNVSYEDDIRCNGGEEWVQCACDRWIHVKCVDEVIIDANGKEHFLFILCCVNSSDFYPCIH